MIILLLIFILLAIQFNSTMICMYQVRDRMEKAEAEELHQRGCKYEH